MNNGDSVVAYLTNTHYILKKLKEKEVEQIF